MCIHTHQVSKEKHVGSAPWHHCCQWVCFAASLGFGSVSQEAWADGEGTTLIFGLEVLQSWSFSGLQRAVDWSDHFTTLKSLAILILQFLKGRSSFGFWSKCCVCWIHWFQRFLLIFKCAFLNYPFLSLCDWAMKGSLAKILTTSAAQHCRNGFPGECAVPSLLDAPSYVTSSSVMKGSEIWQGPSEFFVCFCNR